MEQLAIDFSEYEWLYMSHPPPESWVRCRVLERLPVSEQIRVELRESPEGSERYGAGDIFWTHCARVRRKND